MLENFVAFVKRVDTGWFYSINHGLHNTVFNKVMPAVSNAGTDGLVWIALGLVLLILGRKETKRASVLMMLALLVSYLLGEEGLKTLFHRPRPFETLPGVHLLVFPPDTYSFPSGHAANAFACALVLARKIRNISLPVCIFAVIMAFSRVYVGVHYPLDVLAGALLGVACASFIIACEKRFFRTESMKPPFIP
ncbi:MAG TPA: phosphatase PAP2 family protein [Bacillota bacterium]|nr:phosphatase PAP2 family protein [Bacillota bacterium]